MVTIFESYVAQHACASTWLPLSNKRPYSQHEESLIMLGIWSGGEDQGFFAIWTNSGTLLLTSIGFYFYSLLIGGFRSVRLFVAARLHSGRIHLVGSLFSLNIHFLGRIMNNPYLQVIISTTYFVLHQFTYKTSCWKLGVSTEPSLAHCLGISGVRGTKGTSDTHSDYKN